MLMKRRQLQEQQTSSKEQGSCFHADVSINKE